MQHPWPLRIYVSGGMTGWTDNNKDAFEQAGRWLRARGHTVTLPTELDTEADIPLEGDGFTANDEEYEGFLERDLSLINRKNFDAIVFIRGWKTSGGAGREGRQAIKEGLSLYVFDPERDVLLSLTPLAFLANSRVARLTREEVQ